MNKKHCLANRMKKVLLVVRWPVGGIRTYIRYVYRNYDPSQWELTILAPDLNEMRILIDDLNEANVKYIPVFGMPTDGSSGYLILTRNVFLELFKYKYDLIHSHGFTAGLSCAVPGIIYKTPHLMTSHDVIVNNQFEGSTKLLKKIGMHFLFSLIDVVHSVSYDSQTNFFENFSMLDRKKMKSIVIPNGIEVDRFRKTKKRNLRAELKLQDQRFIIGFMGRFMEQKGFRYLIDAIEILKRENGNSKKFLVLAFGEGAFLREEKRKVLKKGLQDNILFMPFTSNIAGSIKDVDVVVMPSLWEASGLLAMETLACGTPLIASDCIGLSETIKGTPAIIIPKGDANSLARAIKEEMENSSKDSFMTYSATALEKYNVNNTSRQLLELYESLIK